MPISTTANEDDDPAEPAVRLHEEAIAARERGDFAAAEEAAQKAVSLFDAILGPHSPDLANALVEHGRSLQELDRLGEAEAAFERAAAILAPLSELPPDEVAPDVAEDLFRLASRARLGRACALRCAGRLDEAESAYRDELTHLGSRLPEDDGLIASALNDLGVVHKFQGRLDEAAAVYKRALTIVESSGDLGDQATLLHNLGGLEHARGQHAAGEPLARRSVEIREKLLGPSHPTTAADRAAWGALLEGLGRLEEAERAYADAFAVFEAHLGPDSLEVASSLTALAGVWRAWGHRDEAEQAYRRAAEIRKKKLGANHFDLALTLNNLGMLLAERGQLDEAIVQVSRAAETLAASLGQDHPNTRIATENRRTLTERRAAETRSPPNAVS